MTALHFRISIAYGRLLMTLGYTGGDAARPQQPATPAAR
jgi:hypothetical protein